MDQVPDGGVVDLGQTIGNSGILLEQWQQQLILSVLVVALAFFARYLILKYLLAQVDDVRLRYRLRAATTYLVSSLALFALGALWLEAVEGGSLVTYLGFVTAGLAIALRDPLVNLVAWVYIKTMRPFTAGDRIEIDGRRGDVVGQDPFAFQMLELGSATDSDQSTGRVITTPNSLVFTRSVANATLEFDYVWLELPVVVTFESDWKILDAWLLELAKEHAGALLDDARRQLRTTSRLMVEYGALTPCTFTKAIDSGVQVTLRCIVGARGKRLVENAIWRSLLDRFDAEPAVELAYPTVRYFDHRLETGAPSDAGTAYDPR